MAPIFWASFLAIPRGPHDRITRQAALEAGWPRRGIRPLLAAVRRPDLRDFGWRPRWKRWLRIDVTHAYRARHHADRVPPAEDGQAWMAAARYIRRQRETAQGATSGRDAVDALGRALHAAQDVFSHSNHVELDADSRKAVVQALWDCKPPPPGFHLTAFAPGAAHPGAPNDPFPHAHYAKDAPGHNAAAMRKLHGRTAYEAAQDAAVAFSQRILADFLASWRHSRASLGRRWPRGASLRILAARRPER